jgi:hypothetical protein
MDVVTRGRDCPTNSNKHVPFASRLTPYYVKAEILKARERYMEIFFDDL